MIALRGRQSLQSRVLWSLWKGTEMSKQNKGKTNKGYRPLGYTTLPNISLDEPASFSMNDLVPSGGEFSFLTSTEE